MGILTSELLVITGCDQTPEPVPTVSRLPTVTLPVSTDISSLTFENYPKVDGSTSTLPLDTLIACKLLEVKCAWIDWLDGTNILVPDYTSYDEADAASLFPAVVHNGTHGAYLNLIQGEVDLEFVARAPSLDEFNLADSMGVDLELQPVALDAFVFIVNLENPIENLSIRQIQGIYTGLFTEWDQVGGWGGPINPYQRNDNSDRQELMKSLVMQGFTMINTPVMMLPTMLDPINAISEDVLGIGYSVYFYEQFMAPNQKLRLLGVDGVQPNYENIQTREYT
jgi:phosphate transport system substrate-binding protein